MLGKVYEIISKFTDGERLNINYLNESEPSYSIKTVSDVPVRKYLADTELRQFTFDLWYIAPFGDDAKVNMGVIEKLKELANKLEEYEDSSYVFFAIEMDMPPVLATDGISLAKYKMRMIVTYAM